MYAILFFRADIERELRPLLEKWREKLGDSNLRVREAAENGMFAFAAGAGPYIDVLSLASHCY